MAKYESKSLRNLAVVRTRRERAKPPYANLFYLFPEKNERLGRVDDSTSSMDFEPEEQKRRVSISSAANFIEWENIRSTLLTRLAIPILLMT